jgi:Na+/citrate or Na+/malate symporter
MALLAPIGLILKDMRVVVAAVAVPVVIVVLLVNLGSMATVVPVARLVAAAVGA